MTDLLAGLRVVEVALLAPDSLGMLLADLGADVVKVEQPGRGDYVRQVGSARAGGLSFLHLRWNRGKRSIALDLGTPDGVAVFSDLARWADVVIEGLRPGALARRGLGYEQLRLANPSLVMISLSGFGQSGPYEDLATHGAAYDAYAGLAPPERTAAGFASIPARFGEVGTQAGALYGAVGLLAAVLRARATGLGAWLDVAQADAAVAFNAGWLDPALSGASPTTTRRARLHDAVRYQYYETADGRHILFQASEQAFFENFCRGLGREDLLGGQPGADVGEHATGDIELRRELAAIFATRTQAEWVEFFVAHDVPGGPVHVGAEVLADPHFRARARIIEHHHPQAGPLRLLGPPISTVEADDSPPDPEGTLPVRPAPALGEHSREILDGVLGYDDTRVAELIADGVVVAPG